MRSWRDWPRGADRTPLTTDLDLGYEQVRITHPAPGMPRHLWTQGSRIGPQLSWHCPRLRACWPHFWPHQLVRILRIKPLTWSPLTESNRIPSPYHGDALPTELRGHTAGLPHPGDRTVRATARAALSRTGTSARGEHTRPLRPRRITRPRPLPGQPLAHRCQPNRGVSSERMPRAVPAGTSRPSVSPAPVALESAGQPRSSPG